MARYLGPREKIERRIGEKLFLKGERSHSQKSALTRRPYPPGVHGKRRGAKLSEFGSQLRSKQKIRNTYRMLEKQFRLTVRGALDTKEAPHTAIFNALEHRLDNVVFRGGLAQSRDQARQIVSHGHITVNHKRVGIPSYVVKPGDVIGVREQSKPSPYFSVQAANWLKAFEAPTWLTVNKEALTITVHGQPNLDDSGLKSEDLQAIIEYYSR